MSELMVILVLFTQPDHQILAEQLSASLETVGKGHIQVLIGEAAQAKLADNGIDQADVLTQKGIATSLTKFQPSLTIVHIDQRQDVGDQVLETQIWTQGRHENHVSIAGPDEDPLPGATQGILNQLQASTTQGQNEPADTEAMIKAQDWQGLLAALAGREELEPRLGYYQVIAYIRLGNRDAAVTALGNLRSRHPEHFLVAAAAAEMPPSPRIIEKEELSDIGEDEDSLLTDTLKRHSQELQTQEAKP